MDLFKFPFHADVWGTASEWVMICVTLTTAYFLWQTLKSQKEVQQTQNRLLKIEQLRIKEDFKPNLKYSRIVTDVHIDKPDKSLVSIAVRNMSTNPAFNFRPVYQNDKIATPIVWKPNPHTLRHDGEYASLHFLVPNKEGNHLDCQIYFTIEYEDVAGTRYAQFVNFDAFAGQEEFRTYDPKVVKEVEL